MFIFILIFISLFKLQHICATVEFEADALDTSHMVISNYLNDEWLIELDDNSLWKTLPLTKRKKTWNEWWKGINPIEWELKENFFFDSKTWINAELQVYKLQDEIFSGYPYLFQNTRTGEYAFTKPIPFGTKLIPQLTFASKFFDFPIGEKRKIHNLPHFLKRYNRHQNIESKYIIVLDDQSIWKVILSVTKDAFNTKVQQPDDAFALSINHWNLGDEIQLYAYTCTEKNLINERYNFEQMQQTSYLIENQSHNQLIYASPLTLSELIILYDSYAQQRYGDGYDDGQYDEFVSSLKASK